MSAATLSLLIAGESHFGVPVISGTPGIIGGVLSCTVSASYQWKRDGVSIGAATSQTYTQDKNDIGPALTCVTPAGTSNTLRYVPTADVVEWFDPATLTPGSIGTWAGVKGLWTLTEATNKPVASATSINGTPGVTADGISQKLAGTADLSAFTACRVVAAMMDASAVALLGWINHGGALVTTGSWEGYLNDAGPSNNSVYVKGAVAIGGARCSTNVTLASATVMSICADTATAAGMAFLRANGAAQAQAAILSGSTVTALPNATLSIFTDAVTAFWPGTLGPWAIMSGTAQDAALDRVERFCAYRAGIAVW